MKDSPLLDSRSLEIPYPYFFKFFYLLLEGQSNNNQNVTYMWGKKSLITSFNLISKFSKLNLTFPLDLVKLPSETSPNSGMGIVGKSIR